MPRRPQIHKRLLREVLAFKALPFCALVSVLPLAIACGPNESNEPRWDICDSPMIAPTGEVELGHGEPFVPFIDGSEVEIVAGGANGRFHIDVGARILGLEPGMRAQGTQPWAYFRASGESIFGQVGDRCAYRQEFAASGDGYEKTFRLLLEINDLEEALELDDSEVELSLTIVDHAGGFAEDAHTIVLRFSEPADESSQTSATSPAAALF